MKAACPEVCYTLSDIVYRFFIFVQTFYFYSHVTLTSSPCVSLSIPVCPQQCKLACTDKGECCHSQCLGGCSKPNDDMACSACIHYNHEGRCVPDCPNGTFMFEGWRCITIRECSEVHLSNDNLFVIHNRECMNDCPSGFTRSDTDRMLCIACNGLCDKFCRSPVIDSVDAAQSLKECTVIEGNLVINIRSGSECF
ncbi:hypothetical protein AMECASPLE_029430 [Ameca splendens]|uniref:4Fe-4S ferredoxin-type domain-containing protein n=1 Tax=Ameca splendens TaxID=208324 RepID=A0ABV0Y6B0_9TELE